MISPPLRRCARSAVCLTCILSVLWAVSPDARPGLLSATRSPIMKRVADAAPLPAASPLIRTVPVGTNPAALTVDEPTGHVFVLNRGPIRDNVVPVGRGSVTMLDGTTGAVLCTTQVGADPVALAVDSHTRRVFILNGGKTDPVYGTPLGPTTVSVLDAATGLLLHTLALGSRAAGARPLAVDGRTGHVFVMTSGSNVVSTPTSGIPVGGSVTVLDAATGAILHTIHLGAKANALAVDPRTGRVFVSFMSGTDSEKVGCACFPGHIAVLDGTTGAIYSRLNLAVLVSGIAIDARAGRVVAAEFDGGRGDGYIQVLDVATGRILRTIDLTHQAHDSIRADSDTVVLPDGATGRTFLIATPGGYDAEQYGDGPVTATILDTRTAQVLSTVVLANQAGRNMYTAAALAEKINRVLVANDHSYYPNSTTNIWSYSVGRLSILDAKSGQVLRTDRLGRGPYAIAIDQRAIATPWSWGCWACRRSSSAAGCRRLGPSRHLRPGFSCRRVDSVSRRLQCAAGADVT
jgi:DNA-binding beta-propeller fold protein YncE